MKALVGRTIASAAVFAVYDRQSWARLTGLDPSGELLDGQSALDATIKLPVEPLVHPDVVDVV